MRRIRSETVARQRMGIGMGGSACPRGSPMLARFMWTGTHTLSTRIEYDPVVSKWRPDLYPSRFKGACHVCWNRGVDSHTWQLLAHTVLMLLLLSLRAAHCSGLLVPANSVGPCSGLMLLPLPVRVIVQTAALKFTTNGLKSLILFRPRVPRSVTLKRGQEGL